MPACPHCGEVLTEKEWSASACPMCGEGVGWKRGPHSREYHTRQQPLEVSHRERAGWGTLRAGLGLLIVSTTALWGSVAFSLIFNPYTQEILLRADGRGPSAAALTLHALSVLTFSVSVFLVPAGVVMCAAVPRSSGSKWWAVASVACMGLMLGAMTDLMHKRTFNTMNHREFDPTVYEDRGDESYHAPPADPYPAEVLKNRERTSQLLGLASMNLFVLFLWSMTRYLRKPTLSHVTLGLCAATLAASIVLLINGWSAAIGATGQLAKSLDEFGNTSTVWILFTVVLVLWFIATMLLVRRYATRLLRGDQP